MQHKIEPDSTIKLSEITTRGKELHSDRADAEREFLELRQEFAESQNSLYAEGRQKLLIVFQAMDAGGKDGTIRRVFRGVNPQGVRVHSFKAPTEQELGHDFLWRIHKTVPAAGMIGVFNRSHYEDVLVVRVHQIVPENVWRPRYEHINQFEKLLADTGTRILKFYLHISKKEQKKRFQERLDEKEKQWKFSVDDLKKRAFWEAYMHAYEEMLQRCSTACAPWHVIPSDQKWYRNLAICRTIVETIRDMNPQYPPAEHNLDEIVID